MLSPHRHRHRHLLPLVAALLLATLLPGIAAADPADPGGPPDVSGGVELDGSVVRSEAPPALPLTLEADESAVSWDLPFELPAGGGGVEPSLGLSYSSAAGRGLAGVGTSVSGLSVVARCQSTFGSDGVVRPVRWDLSDQLCLDGDRLVKVGGTHGRSGSSYRLRADDGRMVELSGDISSPSSVFRVFNTDGSVSTYGGGSAREGRVDGSGSVLPLRWWIESWTDPTGNRVRYEYESGPAEPGELTPDFRPVRVSWGANDGAGVGFTRGVSFGYVPSGPEPWAQDYEHGARSVRTSVISRVEVVADGEVVRSYRVGYTDDEDGVPDPGPVPPNQPRPPILPQPRWLTVCDRAGVCAPRTDIGWLRSPSAWEEREGDLGFEGQQIHPFVPQAPLEPVGGSLVDTSVWADFDGDGDPDLLVAPQRLASNVDPQWELYAMDAAPTTVVGTGLPVAWQAPWRAELTDDPSWAWEPSVARPAQPIEDDGTPGAELLVGRAAERLGGVFAYAPWGLGGESDVWSTRLVWDDDDGWVEEGWKEARSFDGHPGILSELEVVGVDGGVWSTRELGWSSSDMAGHGLLWHRTGDFDGDGLTDLVVCASSVDTDAWYEQHGKETEFDRFGTDPFLGGQLRLALGSLDGLSLADGGRAVGGGTCGWDDWVYVAPSLEGDGRDQLLQLGARDRAGAAVPPSERAANFTAWRFAPGEQVLASWDSGLPREADEFMRWTGSAGNEAESYTTAADGHELSGHGLRFPGMGEIRFGDVNGDGLADALGVELGAGQDPDLVYEDPRENGFEDEDPLPGRVRVWWNTGTGFVRGPGLDAGFEDTWSWRLQFGSSSIADVNGDGTEDLVYSYQDLTDASIVLQDLGAGAATWVVVTDGDDNDGIHTWFGRPGGLTPGPSLASSTGTVTWSGSSSGVDHRVLALDVDRNGTPDVAQFDPLASRWTFLQARASTGHLDQDGLAGDRVWSLTDGNGRQDLVTWTVDHVSATTTQATPAYPLAARPSTAVVPAALHADSGLDHDGGRVPVSTWFRAWDRTFDRRRGAGLGPRVAEAVTTEGTGSGRVETRTLARFDHLRRAEWAGPQGAYVGGAVPVVELQIARNVDDASVPVQVTHTSREFSTHATSGQGTWRNQIDHQDLRHLELDGISEATVACLVESSDPTTCVPSWTVVDHTHTATVHDAVGQAVTTTVLVPLDDGWSTEVTYRDFQYDLVPDGVPGTYYRGLVVSERVEAATPHGTATRHTTTEYGPDLRESRSTREPDRAPFRVITETERDEFGNPVEVTVSPSDVPAASTTTDWSADGTWIESSTDAVGNVSVNHQFDPGCGLPLVRVDAAGRRSVTDVDGFCRTVGQRSYVDGLSAGPGSSTSYGRTSYGPEAHQVRTTVTSIVSGNPGAAVATADRLGRTVQQQTPSLGFDVVVRTEYDLAGNVARVSAPAAAGDEPAGWTTSTYDVLDRPTGTTGPDGATTTTRYHRRVVEQIDPAGRLTRIETDATGNVVFSNRSGHGIDNDEPDVAGEPWCFEWGPFATLRTARPCQGAKPPTELQADDWGRVLSIEDPQAGTSTTAYDSLDRVVSTVDPEGLVTGFHYDLLGRITSRVSDAEGSEPETETWTYDAAFPGSIDGTSSADGITTTQTYDALNRPSTSTLDTGDRTLATTTTYDGRGRVATIAYPSLSGLVADAVTIAHTYDEGDRLVAVSRSGTGQVLWELEALDVFGNATAVRFPHNRTRSVLSADPLTGAIEQLETWLDHLPIDTGDGVVTPDPTLLVHQSWTWSPDGNLAARQETAGGSTQTETFDRYDNRDQLRAFTTTVDGDAVATTLSYDGYGNLLESPAGHHAYDADQRLTSIDGATVDRTYAYNAAGQVTGLTLTPDADPGGAVTTSIAYDALGRPSSLGHDEDGEISYRRDAAGTLVVEERPGETIVHAGGYELTEVGDVLRSTITVVGSHGPVATLSQQLVEGDEPGPVQVEAVHPADPQNTVTHTTDGIGGLTRRHHSPWGAAVDPTDWRTVLADTDEPSGTTPGWTGHAYRTAQGLVAMGPRLYDPAVGRFLQPDVETPDPEDPFDFNRYPYVRNNPTRYTDPTGHYPEDPGDIGNPSWGLNRPGETADGSRYDLAAFMDHWLGEGATEAALEKVGATYETLRSEYNARLAWAKQTKIGGDLTLYEHAVNQAYGNAAPAVRLRVVEHSPETREVVGQLDAVPAPHGGTLADVVIRSAERKLKWRSADVQMAAPGASVALGVGRVLTPIMQKAAETLGKAGLLTSASTAHLKRQALLQTGRGLAGVTPVSLEGGGPKLVLGLAQVAGTEYRPLVAMEMATRGTSWDLLPTHLNPWSRGAATYAATNEAKVHSLISGVVSEGGSLHFNLGGMRLSRLTGPGSLDASVTEIELWTVMQPEFASRTTFYGGIHP